jgi:hypothetical protein
VLDSPANLAAVQMPDGSIEVTETSGALVVLGDFTFTRNTPYTPAPDAESFRDTRDHFYQVVIDLPASLGAVSGGQVFKVALGGVEYQYVVPANLLPGTAEGERNLETVAAGLVARINTSNFYAAVKISSAGAAPKIRIFDKNLDTGAGHSLNPIVFEASRGGDVQVVADIDKTRLVTGSFEVLTGYTSVYSHNEPYISSYILGFIPVFSFRPVYVQVPVFETVNYVISPRLELLDPAGNPVPGVFDFFRPGTPSATRPVDPGSVSNYDPLLDHTLANLPGGGAEYSIRVSSVITYDKFYPQYVYPGVWGGIGYDLIISVQGHQVNPNGSTRSMSTRVSGAASATT